MLSIARSIPVFGRTPRYGNWLRKPSFSVSIWSLIRTRTSAESTTFRGPLYSPKRAFLEGVSIPYGIPYPAQDSPELTRKRRLCGS